MKALAKAVFLILVGCLVLSAFSDAEAQSTVACAARKVVVHIWRMDSLPLGMRKEAENLIEVARKSEGGRGNRVSRVLGARLRKCEANDSCRRWENPVEAQVFGAVRKNLKVSGLEIVRLDSAADPADVVFSFLGREIVSPNEEGGRKLFLFKEEWGKHCTMNVHALAR